MSRESEDLPENVAYAPEDQGRAMILRNQGIPGSINFGPGIFFAPDNLEKFQTEGG